MKIDLSKYTTPKKAHLRAEKSLSLKIHPDTIYKLTKNDTIKSVKIHGRILILKSSLTSWIEFRKI